MGNINIDRCKELLECWAEETLDSWKHEYSAWDMFLEDHEVTDEEWEFMKDNLKINVSVSGGE